MIQIIKTARQTIALLMLASVFCLIAVVPGFIIMVVFMNSTGITSIFGMVFELFVIAFGVIFFWNNVVWIMEKIELIAGPD